MYKAYKAGRADRDPSEYWYKGEIGFFDFYIIPLAKKLKNCGVFGVSSDEYLNYAENNRKEWEAKGHEVVARMVEKCRVEDSVGHPAQRIPDITRVESELLSKDSANNEEQSRHSSSLTRSKESESTEGAGSHDSKNPSCDSSSTANGASHSLAPVAGLPSESFTITSLSRGALEMSEKRFQKQLARVQPSSELHVKVEQMTFL
jgi:hypothetical protein